MNLSILKKIFYPDSDVILDSIPGSPRSMKLPSALPASESNPKCIETGYTVQTSTTNGKPTSFSEKMTNTTVIAQ